MLSHQISLFFPFFWTFFFSALGPQSSPPPPYIIENTKNSVGLSIFGEIQTIDQFSLSSLDLDTQFHCLFDLIPSCLNGIKKLILYHEFHVVFQPPPTAIRQGNFILKYHLHIIVEYFEIV